MKNIQIILLSAILLSFSCMSSEKKVEENVSPTPEPTVSKALFSQRVQKITYYSNEDELSGYTLFEYNQTGDISKRKVFDHTENLMWYNTFTYNGRKIATISFYDNDDLFKGTNILTYDEKGLLTKLSVFDPDNNLISIHTYEYNENNLLTKELFRDPAENLVAYISRDYEDGKISRTQDYDESDEYYGYHLAEYDENNKVVKITDYDSFNTPYAYTTVEWEEGAVNIDYFDIVW